MTLDEAKEIVAKGRGYDSWKDVEDELYGSKLINICNDAAEVYARSKWDEACEAQKESCLSYIVKTSRVWDYVRGATKPEFNP